MSETRSISHQSGQLYNEATAAASEKFIALAQRFALKIQARRHLTEFGCEPEMTYATLDDVMDLAETISLYIASRVLGDATGRTEDTRARHLENSNQSFRRSAPALRRRVNDAAEGFGRARWKNKFEWVVIWAAPDRVFFPAKYDRPGWSIIIRLVKLST